MFDTFSGAKFPLIATGFCGAPLIVERDTVIVAELALDVAAEPVLMSPDLVVLVHGIVVHRPGEAAAKGALTAIKITGLDQAEAFSTWRRVDCGWLSGILVSHSRRSSRADGYLPRYAS
ncbi:hypothetical protein [Pseudoclavibacter sp. VKM Ac-2867]|uniref:hypothetical protein n=1 Tax=Pseudoclavibacter sp. VKM Ac-2867 TaxID=2783829 RepID=UPI001889E8D0|nr:hypothetical protein [Pseudoclavibacter sp. VKM Ac-2867]MBF4460519.1 hypothetical protein [Pseudoclavibacter sp. VKM Ac-2867]